MLDDIEAVTQERLDAVVGSLPDQDLPTAEKDRISKGLLARKAKVRPVLAAAGWL